MCTTVPKSVEIRAKLILQGRATVDSDVTLQPLFEGDMSKWSTRTIPAISVGEAGRIDPARTAAIAETMDVVFHDWAQQFPEVDVLVFVVFPTATCARRVNGCSASQNVSTVIIPKPAMFTKPSPSHRSKPGPFFEQKSL